MKTYVPKPIAAAIGATFFLSLSAVAVPVQWEVSNGGNGHYYEVVWSRAVSWANADAGASASSYLGISGHLVTITSLAEDVFVHSLFPDNIHGTHYWEYTQTGAEFWAGGYTTAQGARDGWTWVNGEGAIPMPGDNSGYQGWAINQPDNNYGAGSEQYLGLGLFGRTGGWNDEGQPGLFIAGYIVEYDNPVQSVPEAGSCVVLLTLGVVCIGGLRRRLS